MSEWREVALGELIEISHGFAFKGEYFSREGPSVLLTPKNFRAEGGLDVGPDRCKYYNGPVDERFVLQPHDVVVAMTDLKQDAPILGSAGRVPVNGRYLHNQRIGKVHVIDTSRLVPAFLPWLLNSPTVRARVRATATGATVRHTAPARILEAVPRIPPLEIQTRISAVLGTLDELIKMNERRIALLEDLARSLYCEWFVRFRFPGYADGRTRDGDERGVPDGWTETRLGELAAVINEGVSPADVAPSSRYCGLEHMPRRATTLREWGIAGSVTSRKLRFEEGDTLFGKIRPYFHKVVWAPFGGVASADTIVFRPLLERPLPAIVNAILSSDPLVAAAVATSNGTKMPRADPRALLNFRIALPPLDDELVELAELTLGAACRACAVLASQNLGLARTRDLLLPRLVTGRLDISRINLDDLLSGDDPE